MNTLAPLYEIAADLLDALRAAEKAAQPDPETTAAIERIAGQLAAIKDIRHKKTTRMVAA